MTPPTPQETKAEELAACPFCGCHDEDELGMVVKLLGEDTISYVQCGACGARGPWEGGMDGAAVAVWNIRLSPAPQKEEDDGRD